MHRFSKILFSPLGDKGNPAAARRVGELAGRNGATLTMFAAIPEPSILQRALHGSEQLKQVQDAHRRSLSTKLARYAPDTPSVEVETQITIGNPALSIIERVLVAGHDLVVVTTDEDDEDQATIKRLLRKCPCPVWVIRPTRARTQRVLAAVNPDPAEAELNGTILELASSMVDRFGGELHVVHAWTLYGEATMRSSAFMHTPSAEIEELLNVEQASRSAALDTVLAASGIDRAACGIHLLKGSAATVVCELVARQRINVLVMGTVARTGVAGLIMGNTAESILDRVRCSVIATKPSGFVSPVELAGK